MTLVEKRATARETVHAWADYINQHARFHSARVTSEPDKYDQGTLWYLMIEGHTSQYPTLHSAGWFQRRQRKQGPGFSFIAGYADGYGSRAGRVIPISCPRDLDNWVRHACSLGPEYTQ